MAVPTISAAEFAKQVSSGESVEILDVRTPAEYREVHVVGAKNVPLDRLDPLEIQRERNGDSERQLYLICRSGSRGSMACQQLLDAGFSNVVKVEGGTLACEQEDVRLIRGKRTVSLERQVRIAAGSLVLLGVVLSLTVHPYCLGLSAFVGAGLVFAGITDTCGMGMILARMPWNQVEAAS